MSVKGVSSGRKDPITGLNKRQELFCRFYVSGHTMADAYLAAGYDVGANGSVGAQRTDINTIRPTAELLAQKLLGLPKIKDRVAALQREESERMEEARRQLREEYFYDIEKATKLLMEDRHYARTGELGLPNDRTMTEAERKSIPEGWRPDPRAAVQATGLIAKLHGLMIERREITVVDSMAAMTNEELLQFITQLQKSLPPLVDVSTSQGSRMITGKDIAHSSELSDGYEEDEYIPDGDDPESDDY